MPRPKKDGAPGDLPCGPDGAGERRHRDRRRSPEVFAKAGGRGGGRGGRRGRGRAGPHGLAAEARGRRRDRRRRGKLRLPVEVPHPGAAVGARGQQRAADGSEREPQDERRVRQSAHGLAAPEVPGPDRAVPASRQEEPPVGSEGEPRDLRLVPAEEVLDAARAGLPRADRAVLSARGDLASVRVKRQGRHVALVAGEDAELSAGIGVPESSRAVPARAGHDLPVRCEAHRRDLGRVALEDPQDRAASDVPHAHRAVPARARGAVPVRRRVHGGHRLAVTLEDGQGLALRQVPEADRAVAPAREGASRAREGHRRDRPFVAHERGVGTARREVPQPHRGVEARGEGAQADSVDGHRQDLVLVALEPRVLPRGLQRLAGQARAEIVPDRERDGGAPVPRSRTSRAREGDRRFQVARGQRATGVLEPRLDRGRAFLLLGRRGRTAEGRRRHVQPMSGEGAHHRAVPGPARAVWCPGEGVDGAVQPRQGREPLPCDLEGAEGLVGGAREDAACIRGQGEGQHGLSVGTIGADGLQGVQAKVAHGRVVAGGDETTPLFVEGHGQDATLVAPQGAEAAPVLDRPDPHGAVAARGRDTRLSRGHGGDGVLVTRHLAHDPAARGVPQAHQAVGTAGGDQAAARHERQGGREAGLADPGPRRPTRGEVPQGERSTLGADDEAAPVREKGERAHRTFGDGDRPDELGRVAVPEADLGSAGSGDRPPVRREGQGRDRPLEAAQRAEMGEERPRGPPPDRARSPRCGRAPPPARAPPRPRDPGRGPAGPGPAAGGRATVPGARRGTPRAVGEGRGPPCGPRPRPRRPCCRWPRRAGLRSRGRGATARPLRPPARGPRERRRGC